jgi:DNA-nicking Smr family endonuclease
MMAKKKTESGDKRAKLPDEHLWDHVTRDAVPLDSNRVSFSNFDTPTPKRLKSKGDLAAFTRTTAITPSPIAYRQALKEHSAKKNEHPELHMSPDRKNVAGLDKRSSERLRKGQMQIDGKVDLHGMTQKLAHGRLRSFIKSSHMAGKRCVLVVTGKGKNRDESQDIPHMTPGPKGILRSAVPTWLHEPDLRNLVVDVRPARPQHGGDGALYVLLRRRRDLGGS